MRRLASCASLWLLPLVIGGGATAENIDPNRDGSHYAYGENVGWINAEPGGDGGAGAHVGDLEVSGWMWGENIGWISLSCDNTLSCAAIPYGVTNDGNGGLSGLAWSESAGWLSFSCATTASCGAASYGVTIDPATGEFSGRAWGENIGWITFASTGAAPFALKTGWICSPAPVPPTGSPAQLVAIQAPEGTVLSWYPVDGATGYDVVSGDLNTLRIGNGDFQAATAGCVDDDRTTTRLLAAVEPAPGHGTWYLVRGQNCGGRGSYESEGSSQAGPRDSGIGGSGKDCE